VTKKRDLYNNMLPRFGVFFC